MAVEIIWQAYDETQVNQAWGSVQIADLYELVLRDEYRRRVDPRSMLFHRTQQFVLDDLTALMKRGAVDISLESYWARVFELGYEELPFNTSELEFDYRLISYFTSLRMADDYNQVETVFDRLFSQKPAGPAGRRWTFYDLEDVDRLFSALGEISIQDLVDYIDGEGKSLSLSIDSLSMLIQNYVDFYRYTKNNRLQSFYFNTAANIKKWGNLAARKRLRAERVVDKVYKNSTAAKDKAAAKAEAGRASRKAEEGVMERFKRQRRREHFVRGLSDTDPLVRQKAVEYLAVTRDTESMPLLLGLLQDEQPEVRQEVVRALGEIGSAQSVDPLVQVLKTDEHPSVLKSAAYSLRLLGQPAGLAAMLDLADTGVVDVSCELAFFPQLHKQRQAVSRIVRLLEQGDERQKADAAFILGRLPGKEFTELLQNALTDKQPELALCAAAALGNRRDKGAVKKLKSLAEAFSTDWRRELVFKDAVAKLGGA